MLPQGRVNDTVRPAGELRSTGVHEYARHPDGRKVLQYTVEKSRGNRISRGRFVLDGKEYSLACNDVYGTGPDAVANHLHGGRVGFDKVFWKAKPFRESNRAGLRWSYVSPEGEEGYPGTLKVSATYSLSEDGELSFEYRAVTDRAAPVNLTQHAYWNLAGAGSGTVLDQEAEFNCPFYLPVDATLMPTGEVLSVCGTPFDFSSPKPIGRDLGRVTGGYDHCLIVKRSGRSWTWCAAVTTRRWAGGWRSGPTSRGYSSTPRTSWTTTGGPEGACIRSTGPTAWRRRRFPTR
jgi:galactose mutarotase-like enzyme